MLLLFFWWWGGSGGGRGRGMRVGLRGDEARGFGASGASVQFRG